MGVIIYEYRLFSSHRMASNYIDYLKLYGSCAGKVSIAKAVKTRRGQYQVLYRPVPYPTPLF